MLKDTNLALQATTATRIANGTYNSTALQIDGTPKSRHAMNAQVLWSGNTSASTSTGTFYLEHSDDNATWYGLTPQTNLPPEQLAALTTAAATGTIDLPNITTDKKWIRLVCVVSGGGTLTPGLSYKAYLGLSKP